MKTSYLKFVFVLAFSMFFVACDDENVQPTGNDATVDRTTQVVAFKSAIDNATFNLFGDSFKNNPGGGRKAGTHRFSALFANKKEAAQATEAWDTCALITITENEDGTYTVILNFGDGCEEADGRFLQGVVAFTGSETDSSGIFKIGFDKFAEKHPDEPNVENDFTLSGWYKGSWKADPTVEFVYGEGFSEVFELNYENGEQEKFAAEGQLFANETGFEVTKYNFQGTNTTGDTYSGITAKPLIYDYSCTESTIYTKGTEIYNINGNAASVDFGGGACDNILTIQADGITIVINLDELDKG